MSLPRDRQIVSARFTRPADTTAYASGDLVANNTTAGSVVPLNLKDASRGPSHAGRIRRVRIRKSGTSTTNAAFRVHLYAVASITCANGDNGAFSTNGAANYLGQVDVTVGQAFTDGAGGDAIADISFRTPSDSSNLSALIEARGAYTPASAEVFTVAIEVEQD